MGIVQFADDSRHDLTERRRFSLDLDSAVVRSACGLVDAAKLFERAMDV